MEWGTPCPSKLMRLWHVMWQILGILMRVRRNTVPAPQVHFPFLLCEDSCYCWHCKVTNCRTFLRFPERHPEIGVVNYYSHYAE